MDSDFDLESFRLPRFLNASSEGSVIQHRRKAILRRLKAGEKAEPLQAEFEAFCKEQYAEWLFEGFRGTFPIDGYLRRSKLMGTAPRPQQAAFVIAWPFQEIADDIADCLGMRYAEPKGLLLYGSSGIGKTTSIALMLREAAKDHRLNSCLFDGNCRYSKDAGDYVDTPGILAYSGQTLASAIRSLSRTGGKEFEKLIFNLQGCHLLIIDDLDKARFTDRVSSELFNIFEFREQEDRLTIVSTNLNGKTFERQFEGPSVGPAITSRLRRMCWHVDFNKSSFDAEKAAKASVNDMFKAFESESRETIPDSVKEELQKKAKDQIAKALQLIEGNNPQNEKTKDE